jgi:Ser/Thr protein kinase RdoA (MazF antagonist)
MLTFPKAAYMGGSALTIAPAANLDIKNDVHSAITLLQMRIVERPVWHSDWIAARLGDLTARGVFAQSRWRRQRIMSLISPEHALRALEPYGLAGARVQLLSEVDCLVYRVTASGIDGQTSEQAAVLKIYPTSKKEAANIRAEVDWLHALTVETDLRVPKPLAASDGSIIQPVVTGGGEEWPGVLFSWVEGRSLDQELSPNHLRRIGSFVGTLHSHSHAWRGAGDQHLRRRTFTQRVLGWVLEMEQPPTLSIDAWQVLVRAAKLLEAETSTFGEDDDVYGFIHSDLYLSNCLFQGDSVGVIDFSDCAWGHYADDMASSLVFLKHPWVGNFDHSAQYGRLRDAFFDGYQLARSVPRNLEAMLETYFAARILLLFAYVHAARDHVPWVPACLVRCEQFLKDYLQQGELPR